MQTSATLNITDNEPIVSITASDATADETAPTSTGKGTFTITRTGLSNTVINVSFTIQTGEGQAVLGTDYVLRRAGTSTDITNNIITLSSGQTSVVLEVIPIDDNLVESSETVMLTLQTGSNYNINANPAQTTATVTIADNENISVVASDATASETDPTGAGKGSFTIVRNGSSAGEITVNFTIATGNGHALRGTDYLLRLAGTADTLTTSSVTLADGVGSVVIEVIPVDDTLKENSKTVVMTLAPSEQYLINAAQTSATVTIADNETVGVTASLPNASETNPTTNGKGGLHLHPWQQHRHANGELHPCHRHRTSHPQ
ncbi:MAG: hypothetical protein HC898_03730 [Phycisphaerales bacterium]|nr:hypothetical protein [Phycisphaerales bacterium]